MSKKGQRKNRRSTAEPRLQTTKSASQRLADVKRLTARKNVAHQEHVTSGDAARRGRVVMDSSPEPLPRQTDDKVTQAEEEQPSATAPAATGTAPQAVDQPYKWIAGLMFGALVAVGLTVVGWLWPISHEVTRNTTRLGSIEKRLDELKAILVGTSGTNGGVRTDKISDIDVSEPTKTESDADTSPSE